MLRHTRSDDIFVIEIESGRSFIEVAGEWRRAVDELSVTMEMSHVIAANAKSLSGYVSYNSVLTVSPDADTTGITTTNGGRVEVSSD